jgi:O-antigen ligase
MKKIANNLLLMNLSINWIWCFLLSLGWLIPNHYQPWPAFYLEAWFGLCLLLGGGHLVFRKQGEVDSLGPMLLVSAALVCLPLIQYAFGLIPWFADAIVSVMYLAGFALAMVLGGRGERASPLSWPDLLFAVFIVAGIGSLGLQLCQWLSVDISDFLLMSAVGVRPSANLGQPNQLGTLLLWGILAAAWFYSRQLVGGLMALLVCLFFVFGIALTSSRTAWLGLILLFLTLLCWQHFWGRKRLLWLGLGVGVYALLCPLLIAWLGSLLSVHIANPGNVLLDAVSAVQVPRSNVELRPAAWRLFFAAILHKPWFGYGWNQGGQVPFQLLGEFSSIHFLFGHAHNFFLDLMVWCGIPLGVFLSMFLLYWFWTTAKLIKAPEEVLLFAMLVVLGNHAMFELPMNYVYFLMPAGLVIGALDARLRRHAAVVRLGWVPGVVWLMLLVATLVAVRDYSLVEQSERQLRIQLAGFRSPSVPPPPDTWLLNQWHEVYRFAYFKPQEGVGEPTLTWARKAASYFYTPRPYFQLSTLLALNDHPDEARLWLVRFCNVVSPEECEKSKGIWLANSAKNHKIERVQWPE